MVNYARFKRLYKPGSAHLFANACIDNFLDICRRAVIVCIPQTGCQGEPVTPNQRHMGTSGKVPQFSLKNATLPRVNIICVKGKEQMRTKSKLAALGYVPIHICGKRIAGQRAVYGIHAQEHSHITTYWRRGHWRNQVHGPARSLRKLIGVMPVIVGSKSHDEPDTGHF